MRLTGFVLRTAFCAALMGTAQAVDNQLEFNLGRGFPSSSIQVGDRSDQAGSRGTEWSVNLLHRMADKRASWGLGGGQFRSNDNVSQTLVPTVISTITSKTTSALVLLRIDLSSPSRYIPYVIGGLGWAQNSLSITSESRELLNDSRNTLGYAYGLGLDYALNDRLMIGVEARYQGSLRNTYEMTPAGIAATGQTSVRSPLNRFVTSVKAGFRY